jgi:hypothetical protein
MKPSILDKFPKNREDLPPAFQTIYNSHYKRNRQGDTTMTSLSARMERWLHGTRPDTGKARQYLEGLAI